MKKILTLLLFCYVGLGFTSQNDELLENKTVITHQEYELYKLILDYRKTNTLPYIPLSNALTYVAQKHAKDLYLNKPNLSSECNLHSWSDKGEWKSCCYTDDHKQAECMWQKPAELTYYKGQGFEIAFEIGGTDEQENIATPIEALKAWQKSQGHNNVILNRNIWQEVEWNAIGVGMHKGFAVVWFGKIEDEAGGPLRATDE